MSYGNQGYRQQATMAASPFANSIRQPTSTFDGSKFGLGGLLERLQAQRVQARPANPFASAASEFTRTGEITRDLTQGPEQTPAQPANPFEGNEQYQALMEYQKSMAPSQEQQDRLGELRTAFEGTGGYKDYRINQMEQQMQRMQQMRQPRMGMGLGGMRPMGMQPYQGFGRPQLPMRQPMPVPRGGYMGQQMMNQPRQFGAMGYNQPQPYQQQQYGMMGGYQQNPYQQMRPQPQQFGGYGMGQQMGGYGGYGGMQNPYQPQQMGSYNPNNSMGYGAQGNQFQGYMR